MIDSTLDLDRYNVHLRLVHDDGGNFKP